MNWLLVIRAWLLERLPRLNKLGARNDVNFKSTKRLRTTISSSNKGYSLIMTLFAGTMVLITGLVTATLLGSQFTSLANYKYSSDAYAVAKAGINAAVEELNGNNPPLMTQANPLRGQVNSSTNPGQPMGSYVVTFVGTTLESTGTVTDDRLGRRIDRTVSVDLTPQTGKFEESFSTQINRNNAIDAANSPNWNTGQGYLELNRRLDINRVFNVTTWAIYDIFAWNNQLWAGTPRGVYVSPDGNSWQQSLIGDPTLVARDAVFSLQGFNGSLYGGGRGILWRRQTNINWLKLTTIDSFNLWKMAVFNNRLYIAGEYVGDTGTLADDRGRIYEYDPANSPNPIMRYEEKPLQGDGYSSLYTIRVFQNRLYVGGFRYDGYGRPRYGLILRSSDGVNWSPALSVGGTTQFWSMQIHSNKLFAGTYNSRPGGSIYSSADGTNWENVYTLPNLQTSVKAMAVYNNNLFAGDASGSRATRRIYTSPNGALNSWSEFTTLPPNPNISVPTSGGTWSLATFGRKLYVGMDYGEIYSIQENAYQGPRTGAGIVRLPANTRVRNATIKIYPAAGSRSSLGDIRMSVDGTDGPQDNNTYPFTTQIVTRQFNFPAPDDDLRYRFSMLTANENTEAPLVDKVTVNYTTTRYNIVYSTWGTN